ncbi:RedY protein [Streptomyces sp. NPDC058694]|uniref:RedY protein n=1 Tax=Streptomyces sp. NPDC058694 TaxID=3346603 RepID=UPI003653CC74
MTIIIHRIRLHDGVTPVRFETWVRDVDYATCPELPSVVSFSVQRVAEPAAPKHTGAEEAAGEETFHYVEMIEVTSLEDFERDMLNPPFRKLVSDFDQMAKVVDETVGERIGDGYRA